MGNNLVKLGDQYNTDVVRVLLLCCVSALDPSNTTNYAAISYIYKALISIKRGNIHHQDYQLQQANYPLNRTAYNCLQQ